MSVFYFPKIGDFSISLRFAYASLRYRLRSQRVRLNPRQYDLSASCPTACTTWDMLICCLLLWCPPTRYNSYLHVYVFSVRSGVFVRTRENLAECWVWMKWTCIQGRNSAITFKWDRETRRESGKEIYMWCFQWQCNTPTSKQITDILKEVIKIHKHKP